MLKLLGVVLLPTVTVLLSVRTVPIWLPLTFLVTVTVTATVPELAPAAKRTEFVLEVVPVTLPVWLTSVAEPVVVPTVHT